MFCSINSPSILLLSLITSADFFDACQGLFLVETCPQWNTWTTTTNCLSSSSLLLPHSADKVNLLKLQTQPDKTNISSDLYSAVVTFKNERYVTDPNLPEQPTFAEAQFPRTHWNTECPFLKIYSICRLGKETGKYWNSLYSNSLTLSEPTRVFWKVLYHMYYKYRERTHFSFYKLNSSSIQK